MDTTRTLQLIPRPKIEIWYPLDWKEWGLEDYTPEEFLDWLRKKPDDSVLTEFIHLVET